MKISKDTGLRSIFFILFILFPLLAIWAPLYQTINGFPSGESIYSLFSNICHQKSTRSFWITDRPFALCSRCTFGYLGVAFGAFFAPANLKYTKRLLIGFLFLVPGIMDGLMQGLTEYRSNNFLRLVTGLSGGIGIFLIIYPLTLNESLYNILKKIIKEKLIK